VLSRLKSRAQPVPPIFEPEVAARAIVWASMHQRRELMIGFPTFAAVWGDRLVPGIADWYLARAGYESQQTDEPERPDRPSNLWEPVPGDYGARGRFGRRAKQRSWWATVSGHHRLSALAVLLGIGLAAGLMRAVWLGGG